MWGAVQEPDRDLDCRMVIIFSSRLGGLLGKTELASTPNQLYRSMQQTWTCGHLRTAFSLFLKDSWDAVD